jgi:ribosomal protein S18 acetylase RimI-like enzyme
MPIIQLTPHDEKRAVEILVNAFQKDPLYQHVLNNPDQTDIFATFLFRKALDQKEILLGYEDHGFLSGVASLSKAGQPGLSFAMFRPTFLALCFQCFRRLPLSSFVFFLRFMQFTSKAKAKTPHYDLNWIAVAPTAQGSGVGRNLLQAIHQVVDLDQEVIGIVLDTENENNIAFYEKYGYRILATTSLAGLPIWVMFREGPQG